MKQGKLPKCCVCHGNNAIFACAECHSPICGDDCQGKHEKIEHTTTHKTTARKFFVLHPGEETSVKDGDVHFIDARKLCQLYGVSIFECYVVDYKNPETYKGIDFSDKSRLIHLYPKRFRDEYERMANMIAQMREFGMFNEQSRNPQAI